MEFFQPEQGSPCVKAFKAQKKSAGACTASGLHPRPLSMRTESAGNFDIVVDEIEKIIEVLKDNESIDMDQRDWCKKSTFRKKMGKSRQECKIGNTKAKITKLTRSGFRHSRLHHWLPG
jgi:hypothetical protein